jgi:predicted acetyltransferase
MALVPHPAGPEDLPDIVRAGDRAFGSRSPLHDPEWLALRRSAFEPERYLLVRDGPDLVATAGSTPFEVTVPGGGPLPARGVTSVTVAATHRRRGLLRAMMTAQLGGFAAEGLPLCALISSESGIYRRFGYGPAGRTRTVSIERARAVFRADAPDPGGVRYVDAAGAAAPAAEVHRRWAGCTPGAVSRSPVWWRRLLTDPPRDRRGTDAPLHHLLHPDGYASYRMDRADGTVYVRDLFAATGGAHAALWRVLLGLDLVETVTGDCAPLDDPLPWLLTDPRLVRTTGLTDGLWVRVLDVPAVLAARRYPVELDLVLEVRDGSPGRFRLRGGPDGAECARTDRTAALTCDIATLGTLVMGSVRAPELARAGLLDGAPEVLARAGAGFSADREVRHGTDF